MNKEITASEFCQELHEHLCEISLFECHLQTEYVLGHVYIAEQLQTRGKRQSVWLHTKRLEKPYRQTCANVLMPSSRIDATHPN